MEHQVVFYVAVAALLFYLHWRVNRRKLNHPPSPTSLPLLGHMLAMPSGLEHLAYQKLGKELNSDIIFLELIGNHIVVLNSAEAASDLLEKRSALYSGRACPPVLRDPKLFGWSTNPGLMYNDIWRHHRRMMGHWLNPQAVTQFNELQENQTRLMLQRLLGVCSDLEPFVRVKDEFYSAMAASMFQLTYGYHMNGKNDPFYVDLMEVIYHKFKAIMYTNFYVNLFPSMSYIPDWLPGAGWKRTIQEWRCHKDRAISAPFEWTQAQVNAGVAVPSILGALLQEHKLTSDLSIEEKQSRLKELGMSIFTGGADAAATVLINFVAAMVMYPEIQTKAQKEIDEVLGSDRLPAMSDEARLPYINRIILELLRWRPISPTAVPHACIQDDTYRGYDIQSGTIVIGNVWAMSRDKHIYINPEEFHPDRFLDPSVPPVPVFGWGRRKCPGMHFGHASMFIAITSLLSTYTFSKKKDMNGKAIEPMLEDAPNTLALDLKPFQFEVHPRPERRSQLL